MKTHEEIEKEFIDGCMAVWAAYEPKYATIAAATAAELDALTEKRKAALAELDDPMARLIAAGRRAMKSHNSAGECRCGQCIEILDAIDYAEQPRGGM